jgi:alpha/beta hydrolase family protein
MKNSKWYTRCIRIGLLAAAVVECGASLSARVTRFIVEQRESPAYKGQSFGKAGQYEILMGRFFGEIDPTHPLNLVINDIRLAPRNSRGMVEYSATFSLAKPIDMSKASGVLLYTVVNRGNGCPQKIPEANCQHNVFAYAAGHIGVSSGWQGDLLPKADFQTLAAPMAKNPDGSSITGPVLARLANMPANAKTVALNNLTYQRPVSLDTTKATLNKRASEGGEIIPIPGSDWSFADCNKAPFLGTPDPSKVCVKGGFDPTYLYELSYTAKDPLVLGIGYAATRDLNSFLRYEEKDDTGASNPVAKKISWAVGQGSSQSGNFIKSYLHLGFNQDEEGRIVWDGANPHIAGRQLAMNFRFSVPGGVATLYEPGSEAVLWWSDYPDEVRHRRTAGMLERCRESGTCPKIIETFGGSEFWSLRMSANLVGTDAKADIPLPSNVRRYYFPGTLHDGGPGGFSSAPAGAEGNCALPDNPNPERDTMKALTAVLVDWVAKGTPPPPSRYPRLDRGELVAPTQAAMGFPAIPGVPLLDGMLNPFYDYDFGPNLNYNDLSGVISKMPPVITRVLPLLVPKVNGDGNDDVSGVPSVLFLAPLGTYLDWNVTASGFFKGRGCFLGGGFVAFAKTKAERLAAGDPRPSLEERYGTHDRYVAIVRAAAEKAVQQRFLLREEADKLIQQAEASDVLAAK